jgi:hypothetical protein
MLGHRFILILGQNSTVGSNKRKTLDLPLDGRVMTLFEQQPAEARDVFFRDLTQVDSLRQSSWRSPPGPGRVLFPVAYSFFEPARAILRGYST